MLRDLVQHANRDPLTLKLLGGMTGLPKYCDMLLEDIIHHHAYGCQFNRQESRGVPWCDSRWTSKAAASDTVYMLSFHWTDHRLFVSHFIDPMGWTITAQRTLSTQLLVLICKTSEIHRNDTFELHEEQIILIVTKRKLPFVCLHAPKNRSL